MDSVHTVRLKCPTCGQPGIVHWAHPEGGEAGPRRMVAITRGFTGMNRGGCKEPEVVCSGCNDVPRDARRLMAAQGLD